MERSAVSFNSHLTNDEFEKWEARLVNIIVQNQYRLHSNKKEAFERRKQESSICGSLCLLEDILPGEIWKPYPHNSKYLISSYGRVRYDNIIVPQKDRDGKNGYLVLDGEGIGKELLKYFVYELVAVTFLERPAEMEYHIHHITNNGYDNSVSNLIYLTKDQHKRIHETEWLLLKS